MCFIIWFLVEPVHHIKGDKMKSFIKKIFAIMLAMAMVIPTPLGTMAAETSKYADKIEANPVKLQEGQTVEEFIKNPKQPDLYTLRSDYNVERDGKYFINFQPYVATVGQAATEEEQEKVNKIIKFPEFPGYGKPKDNGNPIDDFLINYKRIIEEAIKGESSGDSEYGKTYKNSQDFRYDAEKKTINVIHVFQNIDNFEEYGNKPGKKDETKTTAEGSVGSNLKIKPLPANEIKGFVPETESINIRVPLNTAKFTVEYRYNRNHYDITFDTDGGTEVPTRTLYYQQVIPTLDTKDIPKKVGATFQGWKPSVELKDKSGKTFKAGEAIKDTSGKAIEDLKAQLIMPAENVKFTAVWKENPKANYTIQFWTEKADSVGYDYIGAKVVKDADTGTRPDLSLMMPSGIKFPEIDKSLTEDAKVKELNKYYVRNEDKIIKENTENVKQDDGTNLAMSKKVQPDGRTTYNIYYDRQRYTMLFEKFCIDEPNAGYPAKEAKMVLPDGTKYDSTKEVNKPYNFVAKFGERMKKWPNDMWLIGEGGIDFDPNTSFIGWQLNSENNQNLDQSLYLDTPPYWLTSKDFIDRDFTELDPAVTPATHSTSTGERLPERTISLGPCSSAEYQFAIYYMEYLFEGFDGALHYNPDMSYTKIDTIVPYPYPSPGIVGFTPKYESINPVDDALLSPKKKIGYTEDLSKLTFEELGKELDKTEENRKNSEKSFFDPIAEKGINGVPFKDIPKYRFAFTYEREKYNIYLDTDPSDINEHSELAKKKLASGKDATVSDVYYDIPLRKLNLDEKYKLTEADRPANVPEDFVFKGWAMDPQGTKLIKDTIEPAEKLEAEIADKYEELAKNSKDKEKRYKIQNEIKELKEKLADADANMPNYDIVLYAKWEEPDYKWKITFDPNGGKLDPIDEEKITSDRKTIREGDAADQKDVTYAKKEENDGDKQIFTVVQRQKLLKPENPTRERYTFMGWEVQRFKKDANTGEYTDEVDNSYRETYGVPELYSFGNDVVSPIYLKAIWVKNDLEDVRVHHYFLDDAMKLVEGVNHSEETIGNQRANRYVAAIGSKQDDKWILASAEELKKIKDEQTKKLYEDYQKLADELGNRATKGNTYFQTLLVEAKKKLEDGTLVDSPNNEFRFFYRPFRSRQYKVNYVDERAKTELDKASNDEEKKAIIDKYRILDQEEVTSLCRHYDARNYKPIIGWKLTSDPQQQLFYDVDEDNNKFLGINGTGSDEITFFYKDVRVIEVPKENKTPKGYVRVTFKASEGGSFGEDKEGKPIKEINYDVLEGIKFDLIPVPLELKKGEEKDKDKYYITPEDGKTFEKWDQNPLLPANNIIKKADEKSYVFTAIFDWFNLTTEGMVTTEAFNDPANIWTNDFAPKLDDLKKLIKAKGKNNKISSLPEGANIDFFTADDKEVKTPADIYELVSEKGKPDAEEKLRTINLKAKVKIEGEKNIREINVPIKVYKNRYDAKPSGEMPDFLKEATNAPNGDLVKLLSGKNYVKVTVDPTSKIPGRKSKVYYVNPKAWVEIPEMNLSQKEKETSRFKHWSADRRAQNEAKEKNGVYKFSNRHKFTKDTVIAPIFDKENNVKNNPITGDSTNLRFYVSVVILAIALLAIYRYQKTKKNKDN